MAGLDCFFQGHKVPDSQRPRGAVQSCNDNPGTCWRNLLLPSQLQVAHYDNVVVELRRDTNLAVASKGAKKKNEATMSNAQGATKDRKLSCYLLKVYSTALNL